MITLKPQFISVDLFNNFFGMNLSDMLKTSTNEGNKAEAFLYRVENRLMAQIDVESFRNFNYCELTPFQMENFQIALLYQAMYMWQNGDLGLDSGYSQEGGIAADNKILGHLAIPATVKIYLKRAGLYNQNIKPRKRFLRSLESYSGLAPSKNGDGSGWGGLQ